MESMFLKEEHAEVELEAEYHWVWRAWNRLTDERQWTTRGIGMPMGGTIIVPSPCRIPWTSVQLWCDVNEYGPEQSALLDDCLCAMDATFITWWAETQTPQK